VGEENGGQAKEMRIQITLEDKGNGQVKVVFNPSLADMVKRAMGGELSPAQQYAVVMADAVHKASQKLDKYDPKRIITPGEL